MQKLCGWVGKILKVDLTHKQIEILDTMAYAEKFLGGLGIGQKLYWDHAAWGADAFDEQQPLIFMTGPLAATPAPERAAAVHLRQVALHLPGNIRERKPGRFFCR